MNANELLCYLTERQVDSLFEAARKFPADKLGWSPTPNTRSALDQLQEIATALPIFLPGIVARKVVGSPEIYAKWAEDRAHITSLDELEKLTKDSTQKLLDVIRSTPESELGDPVEMPFPGEYKLADLYAYHYWNAGYHEGQINYLRFILEGS